MDWWELYGVTDLDMTPISRLSRARKVAVSGGHPMITEKRLRRTANQQNGMRVQTPASPELLNATCDYLFKKKQVIHRFKISRLKKELAYQTRARTGARSVA